MLLERVKEGYSPVDQRLTTGRWTWWGTREVTRCIRRKDALVTGPKQFQQPVRVFILDVANDHDVDGKKNVTNSIWIPPRATQENCRGAV
jgi:hypothetical protein